MRQARAKQQQELFEEARVVPVVRFPPEVQQQLRQALLQWLRAVAKAMRAEGSNEQDHR